MSYLKGLLVIDFNGDVLDARRLGSYRKLYLFQVVLGCFGYFSTHIVQNLFVVANVSLLAGNRYTLGVLINAETQRHLSILCSLLTVQLESLVSCGTRLGEQQITADDQAGSAFSSLTVDTNNVRSIGRQPFMLSALKTSLNTHIRCLYNNPRPTQAEEHCGRRKGIGQLAIKSESDKRHTSGVKLRNVVLSLSTPATCQSVKLHRRRTNYRAYSCPYDSVQKTCGPS